MTETVNFKIQSNRNKEVYVEGFVEIHDDLAEDVDWFYYDAQGFPTPQMFIEHDGVDGFKGATGEQVWEVEQFRGDYGQDAFWIDTCILQSTEEENRTYVRENCTLIINDGAEFEVEYEDYESTEWDADYYMAFTPKWNGEIVSLEEDIYWENPFTYEEFLVGDDILHENGAYIVEVPKCIWEDPEEVEMNAQVMDEMCDSFLWAFKKSYVKEIGIYGIAYEIVRENLLSSDDPTQAMNEGKLDALASNWEQTFEDMDINELYFMTSDDIEKLIKEDVEGEC